MVQMGSTDRLRLRGPSFHFADPTSKCYALIVKTTVELPDEILKALEAEARRRSIPTSELIAELVSLALASRTEHSQKPFTDAEADAWLAELQAIGASIYSNSVDDRSMVEILLQDRR